MEEIDVVYFVKPTKQNEELRYSLRSVEQNFPHHKVWIYGGKPDDIEPDEFVPMKQYGTKWQRVRNMLVNACKNGAITDEFFIFNDDFFVMKPIKRWMPIYDGSLYKWIVSVEGRNYDEPTEYTRELRKMIHEFDRFGFDCELKNYAIHAPMLVNKSMMLEVLLKFKSPMFRAIYGNYWQIGGIEMKDAKIIRSTQKIDENAPFLSSDDNAFATKEIGRYVRSKFTKKSRFEK